MKSHSRILVFGPAGQVGTQFCRLAGSTYDLVKVDRAACDLTDARAVRELVLRTAPDGVVNAAAYTAVDKAETDEATCFAVNAAAPGAMAEAAHELGIPLVHYSTDYVFNGQKTGAYLEQDPTGPLGVYGRTKLEGEQRIEAQGGAFVVLRTSWVYEATGNNFLQTMLRLGAERPELRVVSDQTGAPTSAGAIAAASVRILEEQFRAPGGQETTSPPSGVYHMTAGGSTTWFGFTERIFALALEKRLLESVAKLTPITTADYPTPARRPKNSVLSNDRFAKTFGFRLPDWEKGLAEVMEEIVEQKRAALRP